MIRFATAVRCCVKKGKGLDKRRGARARRCSETTCEGIESQRRAKA
nr:MAG TPA: hypothetical protein [Caudoviricetes sp.]